MTDKKILPITIVYLLLIVIFGAHHKANASNDESRTIDELLKDADTIRSTNPKQLTIILDKIKEKNKQLSSNQKHYLNYLLAYQHSFTGQFEESITGYKEIINSNASKELKFRANSSIVNIYAIAQNWSEGLAHLSNNFDMLEEIEDKKVQEDGLIIAVIFYNLIGQYELGLTYAQRIQSETQEARPLCFANHLVLEAKLKLKQLDENSEEINEAINSCEKINEKIVSNVIRTYLARVLLEKNQATKTIDLLLPKLDEVEKTNYAPVMAGFYELLSQAYFKQRNLVEATQYAHKALSKTDGPGNMQSFILSHSILYKVAVENNDNQAALAHYIKYAEANKAHLEDEKNKYLDYQLAVHKELEQKNQIALLNQQNDLLIAEQALIKANAENTRFILLILIIVISILLVWGSRLLQAHKRIKQLAEYDSLTGIYNRGHFSQIADSALEYCKSADQELSIIMFDLDYFKKVNDDYGHACGDWALKNVIYACKAIGRQNDIFARLGGEEFCILLTSCDKHSASQRAETYRQAIANITTKESGFDFNITASFGVTDTKTSGYDLDDILADADSAAYASKYDGRNQVTIFQSKEELQEKKNKKKAQETIPLDSSRNAF